MTAADVDACMRAWITWHDGGGDRELLDAARLWMPDLTHLAHEALSREPAAGAS